MVRIGTWNVENLFRPGQDSGPTDTATYEAKLDALATTLTQIAPDVLAVQEVGGPAALQDLADRAGGGWERVTATVAAGQRPIRVGFLSRHPITVQGEISELLPELAAVQVEDDRAKNTRAMSRVALHAQVMIDGRPIELITCHLKSKLLSFPPGPSGGTRFNPRDEDERSRYAVYALNRRAAEAATVRAGATAVLDNQGSERAVVLLGDLNDEPEAATTQILHGPPGSEIGTTGYDRPDSGDGQRLWNLAACIPEAQRFSRRYRGRGELIDHILVSHALVGRVAPDTVRTDAAGEVPSITDNPSGRRDAAGSDHRPVFADISL